MIDWNSAHWKLERAANEFAHGVINELAALRPAVLRDLGWSGIELFRRSLMAAWLSRQTAE